jgi:hypothetical protein
MGSPPIKKLTDCINNILFMEWVISLASLSATAFSSPHNEASVPLILASPFLGLNENNAPDAWLPAMLPVY